MTYDEIFQAFSETFADEIAVYEKRIDLLKQIKQKPEYKGELDDMIVHFEEECAKVKNTSLPIRLLVEGYTPAIVDEIRSNDELNKCLEYLTSE